MHAEWDESYFDAQREDPSIYWVCFWTGDDVEQSARHDPQRITGAGSVAEVLEWVLEVKEERRFELFVETTDRAESRAHGWIDHRKLIRLAGDFTPGGTTSTISFHAQERRRSGPAMQREVGGVVIEVTYARTDDATPTPDEPVHAWTITLSGAGIDHTATVGLVRTLEESDDDVFARVLEVAVTEYVSLSEDTDPLATPAIREWKRATAAELQELVATLRATDS